MTQVLFPVIDMHATGENIIRLRKARGLSVRQLQHYFGFEEPQAIYKWQQGKCLPSVDNLLALSCLLGVSMNDILVQTLPSITDNGQSFDCPFNIFRPFQVQQNRRALNHFCCPFRIILFIKDCCKKIIYNQSCETKCERMSFRDHVIAYSLLTNNTYGNDAFFLLFLIQ